MFSCYRMCCTKTLTMQNFAAYSAMARTLSRRTAQDRRSCASRGGLRYRSGCRLPFLPPQRSYVQTRVPLAICQRFQCHHRWQHRRRRRRPPPVRGARGNGAPTHTPTHTPIHPHTHKQGSRRLFLSRSVIYLVRELVLDDGFSRMDMMETGKHSEKVLSIVPVHRSCTKTL